MKTKQTDEQRILKAIREVSIKNNLPKEVVQELLEILLHSKVISKDAIIDELKGYEVEEFEPIQDYPGRPKTNWALICRGPWDMPEEKGCGRVYLSDEEYDRQMHPSMADKTWRCPICMCECWPDDSVMSGDREMECRCCGSEMVEDGGIYTCLTCGEIVEAF